MVKVLGWYDNEWGYSNRLVDLTVLVGSQAASLTALPGIDSLGDVSGKRVLVRADLNVPLDGGNITDDGRIRASVPTLERLLDAGAEVVVVAHLGRPKGAPDPKLQPGSGGDAARSSCSAVTVTFVEVARPDGGQGRRRTARERQVRSRGDVKGRGRAR